mgnify:CR=1 FL=1
MAETTRELDHYLKSTPKSKALWEDAKNYLPGGDSRNSIFWAPYPIFVDHAAGCHVVDSDGVDRLDFIGTMTTLVLGHSPKPVVDAVQEQMKHGVVYNAPNAHQVRLAECRAAPAKGAATLLRAIFPAALFSSSCHRAMYEIEQDGVTPQHGGRKRANLTPRAGTRTGQEDRVGRAIGR